VRSPPDQQGTVTVSNKVKNMKKKVGLIINPIAGMGGRVGLKGSDGREILERAMELGAEPEAPKRAVCALRNIVHLKERIELITYPHEMGEDESSECGFVPTVTGSIKSGYTTSEDTKKAAKRMAQAKVDLLLFAGGDGTARDICSVIGCRIPVLGIPAGVKIHSAVFATNPRNAGELAAMYLGDESLRTQFREAEVMDIDEVAFRSDRLSAQLYGYLKIPYKKGVVQCAKAGSRAGEEASVRAIACDVINNMEKDWIYIIGPGTTTRSIMVGLGLRNALLGVDAVCNREILGLDLNESQLLNIIEGRRVKIIVGVIGGQGYIFGRGNQQISPRLIKKIGKKNIIILATMDKIVSLREKSLLVDTGDVEVDRMLAGYVQVVSGLRKRIMLKIK